MIESRRRGILLTAIGAFWAAAYLIPYKAAAQQAPAESLVLPLLLAAAVLNTVPLGVGPLRRSVRINRLTLTVALLLGAFSALGNEAVARALAHVDPGVVSTLLRTQVVFVALGGWWLLREKVTLRFWLGTLLALAGFILLRGGLVTGAAVSTAGLLWGVVAATCFAAMQVIIRRAIKRVDAMVVNSLRLWLGAVFVLCVPGRLALLLEADLGLWLLMGTAALVGPVISRIFLMLALRHMEAAPSTLILFLAPVFAYLLAGLFFHRWPGAMEMLGSLIILVGVALPVVEVARSQPLQEA
jgi:drug/metabolite transporter (DMT)-like permease